MLDLPSLRLFGGDSVLQFCYRTLHRLRQHLGRLRAADGENAAEDEAGHAVDAGSLGGEAFALDTLDVLTACEALPHLRAIQAAIGGGLDQSLAVVHIAAFG